MTLKQIKTKQKLFFIFLLSFTLIACTQPAEDPKAVADKYWQYLQSGNISEAEKLVSINSQRAFPDHSSRIDPTTQLKNGEAKITVGTTITTTDQSSNFTHTQTFDTVLILEQGKWKIDVNQSQIPPAPGAKEKELKRLADELSQSMQKNIDSIDESMTHGMQMLNEALQEGSKEMGDSLLHLMNELNSSMQDAIDKMKQRRQQQMQQQPSPGQEQEEPPQPDPAQGEGML